MERGSEVLHVCKGWGTGTQTTSTTSGVFRQEGIKADVQSTADKACQELLLNSSVFRRHKLTLHLQGICVLDYSPDTKRPSVF